MIFLISLPVFAKEDINFKDIPRGHWAEESIYKINELNIIEGVNEDVFGLGNKVTKVEFSNWLNKLLNKDLVLSEDKTPLTREQMALILVKELGLDSLANSFKAIESYFHDIKINKNYIAVINDMGIVTGKGKNFNPDGIVTKEQAAIVLLRVHEKVKGPLKEELHGFYAIKSYGQKEMIKSFNSIGFGWSKLEVDKIKNKAVLNMERDNNNDFGIPKGFSEVLNIAKEEKVATQLMVFADNKETMEYVLLNEKGRKEAINEIVEKVNKISTEEGDFSFDGVIIDFEGMKGEKLRKGFNVFLTELKSQLVRDNKTLYVTVHPRAKSSVEHFDGYDYRHIGKVVDKVILMAHDYYPKKLNETEKNMAFTTTPITPINEIYYALKYITDQETGVEDTSKILLQISFDSVQWKLKDGKIINDRPYHPTYDSIRQRLVEDRKIETNYAYGNPYMKFKNEEDGTDNIVWYENEKSVREKIQLGKMFGIKGVSLWRLGTIPDYNDEGIYLNIWQEVLKNLED